MRRWIFLLTLFCALPMASAAVSAIERVKTIHLKRDEIAIVRTAIGIATIIQVPDHPTSVVLGDTNAFKVEYLDNAITIKPLRSSAKSNLYIYTEGRRFNVSLITEPLPSADYIIYLEPEVASPIPATEKWRDYHSENKNRDFVVNIRRLGRASDTLMLAFQVTPLKPIKLNPEWIWLTQNGKTVAIQDLNLSAIEGSAKNPIVGFLSVKVADLRLATPAMLEFRSQTPIKIKLPEVKLWMR